MMDAFLATPLGVFVSSYKEFLILGVALVLGLIMPQMCGYRWGGLIGNFFSKRTKESKTMTVKHVTKTENVTRTVTEAVTKNIGVQYESDSSDRGFRITPSTSMPGRWTLTVSNPDGSNELSVIVKKADLQMFLRNALALVA